ncbi:hypothetical protein BD289DRAFT_455578 [Coniella lustricola]|uniref:Autophagy-related protein 14 n=1 Tax=Coniella lustricola TaxID=2025994 RepID=A0A2T2ZZ67_9PEZI|nr:hypothetical protein BD289DRAFT_455578 [Coniella lustricola]
MAESSRPLLLAQNRKVRHLRAIFLRNLTFDRIQGRSADDSEVKHSPGKAEALRESSKLQHSASTENLYSLRPASTRRRSTNLGSATPLTRQKHIEASIDKRVANVFFSLHLPGDDGGDPLYISEVGERATNFDFRSFELSRDADATVLRSPQLTVKVWTQRSGAWSLHLEQFLDLRRLNFLGGLVGTNFPPNCLIFHLIDGAYTLELPAKPFPPKQGLLEPTSSYNALMRLSTLGNSIQDALATQDKLKEQICSLVADHADSQLQLTEADDGLKLANKYVTAEQRAVKGTIQQIEHLQTSITDRRDMISQGRSLMDKTDQDMKNALAKLVQDKEQCNTTKDEIRGQRRRICEDLNEIFRIEPVPNGKPLQFQIRGIYLPNAEDYGAGLLSGAQEDELSAALGHVALLTQHLEMYLSVPLAYPITCCGSRSYVTDHISILKDPVRDFPLYIPRGGSSAHFRFDYGWFILNKNIETLCTAQGLKVMDIRHTLPNLKYLLYVCSAGTDELPERKKGGVRGLRAGIMRSRGISLADDVHSLASSRRGSVDSDMPAGGRPGDGARNRLDSLIASRGKVRESDSIPDMPDVDIVFQESFGKVNLRTKGMREHVAK